MVLIVDTIKLTTVIFLSIFLIILGLAIFTINKGYAFEDTIDQKTVEDDKKRIATMANAYFIVYILNF